MLRAAELLAQARALLSSLKGGRESRRRFFVLHRNVRKWVTRRHRSPRLPCGRAQRRCIHKHTTNACRRVAQEESPRDAQRVRKKTKSRPTRAIPHTDEL